MRSLLLFVLLICSISLSAKQPRILIILDGSSSMLEAWDASSDRFRAAAGIITRLMDSVYAVNDGVEFALRVYGHQHPAVENNCYDSKLEVMFSKNNLTQMELRLAALVPRGITPVSFSLREAAEFDLVNLNANDYSIVLITDGGESCGGDICATALDLWRKKILVRPYIIGLVNSAGLKQQYNCLGDYLPCFSETDVPVVIDSIVKGYRKLIGLHPRVKEHTMTLISPAVKVVPVPVFSIEKELIQPMAISPHLLKVKIIAPVPKPYPLQIPKFENEEDGFGYVKFTTIAARNVTALFYQNMNGAFILLEKLNFGNLTAGQKIQLKCGKYKIEYKKPISHSMFELKNKVFTIYSDMITELDLN